MSRMGLCKGGEGAEAVVQVDIAIECRQLSEADGDVRRCSAGTAEESSESNPHATEERFSIVDLGGEKLVGLGHELDRPIQGQGIGEMMRWSKGRVKEGEKEGAEHWQSLERLFAQRLFGQPLPDVGSHELDRNVQPVPLLRPNS